jgi:hypothetical protein
MKKPAKTPQAKQSRKPAQGRGAEETTPSTRKIRKGLLRVPAHRAGFCHSQALTRPRNAEPVTHITP